MSDGLYIQYGCGWDAPEGWLNFDASPTLRLERMPLVGKYLSAILKGNDAPFPNNVQYGDIVKGLPLDDETCRAIYCSHVLEHLSFEDFRKALRNTRKILKPGGLFRLVIPDLGFHIKQYIQDGSADAAVEFMKTTGLGHLSRARGPKDFVRELMGNSRHRWMWDYPSLQRELERAEFKEIRRAVFGDSSDANFNRVERQERWTNCLGIECRRI